MVNLLLLLLSFAVVYVAAREITLADVELRLIQEVKQDEKRRKEGVHG